MINFRNYLRPLFSVLNREAQRLGATGDPWAATLETALQNGKLHGIAVSTPYATPMKQQYGNPYVLDTWNY